MSAFYTAVRIPAVWGLDRISHRDKPSIPFYEYTYDSSAGENATVYVVDTGIHIEHEVSTPRQYSNATAFPRQPTNHSTGIRGPRQMGR
jgi:hypothetical protein